MGLLHELISEFAILVPEKTAVEDVNGKFTYGELAQRSASLATVLASRGFHAGDAAAVYVPYAKEIILGADAVLCAGGIYVPFDDSYPVQRLEYMLRDCKAKAILTVRKLWNKKPLDFPADQVFFLDEQPIGTEITMTCEGMTEDSPAMLLYTSGTTGKPKGVLHSHSFLLGFLDYMKAHEGAEMNAYTRSGVISSVPFVGTQMVLLGPLAHGGTVCIAPEAARKDLGFLNQFLHQAHITHIFIPSGLATLLAEDYDIRGIWIFAGGEKMRPFRPHTPGNCLINIYGSTETSAVISKKIFGNEKKITVGKPYATTKVRLVDENLKDVQVEEIGEMLLSNGYMSRQYYHLPEQSAEKWGELDGDVWFRTGDRAKRTENGDFEILGRTDNMIKLRGFRIETGEVEAQIANAAVKIGADIGMHVVVKKTVSGTEHLCCYYEARQEMDSGAISEEIAKYLADYMVPDIWVRMDQLPRNVNGKVLRNEMPQPRQQRKASGSLDNEIVARVVWTAADVLEISEMIGPEDSFTGLGGTSLTALLFVSRLRDQGIRISVGQVLKAGSLRIIAEAADVFWEQLWTPKEFEKVQSDFAQRGEQIEKVLPIASWQDEMLFDQIIYPDRVSFKDVVLIQLDSVISQAHLREALDILASENEALRAAVVYHGVTTVQQVITDRKIPLKVIEDGCFGKNEMNDLRRQMLYMPMNLQFSSLMQLIAVHAGHETYLYVLTHRIAFGMEKRRAYLARFMRLLEAWYPDDVSIRTWREILEAVRSAKQVGRQTPARETPAVKTAPPEICIYSENKGPKLVFVHTGNTGSEAYYRLADRIKERVSFAVIEPFNLYHPDQARYGIRQIAARYIEILKRHQPQGPYLLGGWCYGGVVAHEMACQMEKAGEDVHRLFLLDAHAMGSKGLVKLSKAMHAEINREYFETCPLFAGLRESGMLDAMITNAAHVSEDLMHHIPSHYRGNVTYFKPMQIPAAASESSRMYWSTMMEFAAGNYERYCQPEKLRIVSTPHEHDLMMDDPSLDIIVPEILNSLHMDA